MMKVFVLLLIRVLAATSVTPLNVGSEGNSPTHGVTEYNPVDITTEPDVLISESFDSLRRDGPTRFQNVESTSQFDAVTSTDRTEWESFSVTAKLINLRNTLLDIFTENVTQNEGINGVKISADPNSTVKRIKSFNESESNTPRTVTTSGNDDFHTDNNKANTTTADISDKSATLQFGELKQKDIQKSNAFHVMNDGINLNPIHCKTFQEGNDTTPESFVPFLAEDFLRKKITEMNLNKCSCPPYHLREESSSKCVATQASFVEVLTNPITLETCFVPEANFRQIQLINLSCYHPLRLHQMDYKVLLSGDAQHNFYDTIIKSSQFCMENIEFSDGHREWNIFACLEPPLIPKCCAKNQIYDVATMACVGAEPSSSRHLDGVVPTLPGAVDHNLRFTIPVEQSVAYPTVPAELQASAGTPTCSGGRKLVALHVGKNPQNSALLVNSLHDVRLNVFHSDFKVYKYLRNTDYCVDWSSNPRDEVDYVAVFCYEDPFKIHHSQCSLSRNCIRKCCPGDEILDMISLGCTAPHDRQYLYRPRFYHHSWAEDSAPVLKNTSYEVVHGEPFCRLADAQHEEDFYLLDDGTAYFPKDNRRFTSEYYCVDAQQGSVKDNVL